MPNKHKRTKETISKVFHEIVSCEGLMDSFVFLAPTPFLSLLLYHFLIGFGVSILASCLRRCAWPGLKVQPLPSNLCQDSPRSQPVSHAMRIHALNGSFLTLFIAWLLSDEADKAVYRQRYSVPLPSLSVPDAVHGTFDEFTARTSRIVPLAMAMLRAQTTNVTNKLKLMFDLNWSWLPGLWHSHDVPQAKVALSADEYQRMLGHINSYIDTIVDKKLHTIESSLRSDADTIDPKVAVHIANIVQQQIVQHKYVLSDADVERIAAVVHQKLAATNAKGIPLTQATLEEISRMIQHKIEIHRHEWNVHQAGHDQATEATHAKLDVQELLHKVLTSAELADFVETRLDGRATLLSTRLNDHQSSIDTLRSDMNDLKVQLKAVFAVNEATTASVDRLQSEHGKFGERLASMDAKHSEQLSKLLATIDAQLSASSARQSDTIDNHIRSTLAEIFGYRSGDGKPLSDADLAGWIQSIFVAKELLESRLHELNSKFEHRFADEMNHMAEMVIGNVSETIKQHVAVALAKGSDDQRSEGASIGYESLDEAHIRKLIQKALATYDADKTGMVDYALESSGGEVLSTR